MNDHYTYFLILAASVAGPLALSFDTKVAFYKKWKYVFPATILPAIFFIIWDIVFTKNGVWSFNDAYITGFKIVNIPIEEVLFFFIVPYCCTFIYECIRSYFPQLHNTFTSKTILQILATSLFLVGIFYHDRAYTFYTFIFNTIFILLLFVFQKFFKSFNNAAFLLSYCIILLPFLAVNGFLTAIPVVMYNNTENLDVRIFTIPFEDVFYGMLLVMMNISIFEKLRYKSLL